MKKYILVFTVLFICGLTWYALKNSFADKTQNQITDSGKPAPKDYSEIGFELMNSESIGALKIGLSDNDVIKALGEPEEKSEMEIWGADGENHQTWNYKSKGIQLDMIGDLKNQVINSMSIKSPCDFKTKRGIGIGSSRTDVSAAYKNEINNDDPSVNQSVLIAGSVYGGIIFSFENGTLTTIFIGAAAE
ncbi:MAG: hypothetical protein BWY15_00145 [Firmicutes bacterium ADurb.Bin193]|nr:MAG: hypothetical protein BWY15_00145 [Firmicutes bacterium ADurb.Bin193]